MNSNEFIPTRHEELWAEIAEVPQAKATIVFVDGSGEYRTVSMRKTALIRQWFNSEGFSFLTYDKYGCGESGGKWAQVTLDILVDCLIDVCKFAKSRFLKPLAVVGQSEGAMIGAEAASKSKEIDALVLMCCSSQEIAERMHYQLISEGTPNSYSAWEEWQHGIEEIKRTVEAGNTITGFLLDHPKTYWASRIGRRLPADLIGNLEIPIFALNGERDEPTPPKAYLEIHKVMENARNRYSKAKAYPDVGHSLRKHGETWGSSEADRDIIKWLNSVFQER